MNEFQQSLPMMLYRTLDSVMPGFRAIFNEFGITEQQWRVLRVLWENDGCGLQELAASTLISGPSLVGVIDRLTRDGFVERRRSRVDRRSVHVHLTRRGKVLEKTVRPRVTQAYAALEASVKPATWQALRRALDEITRATQARTLDNKPNPSNGG